MKSGLRRLANAVRPPVQLTQASPFTRGGTQRFNLGIGQGDRETFMRQYGMSGTVFAIVSLLAESSATPCWRLYKKQPVDGRRRYATTDRGSDQRTEVISHAALKLWDCPNELNSGFEFREMSQLHEEMTGETYWVLNIENAFKMPTSMWNVRPDRMEPCIDEWGALVGWKYLGPNGDWVPLKLEEVIVEKRPDPLDPYRGIGPVQAIMPNIQQQRYATEYQRNLFINGASPGGVITVDNKLSDLEFDELVDRWRESHRGVARAGHIGVLENGATWTPASPTNREMEYGDLRLANRDELREAWRVHKSMLGQSDDVNRANAQTAEETFVAWQVIPRLNRRRETLNHKLLPMFGAFDVEFDYEDPSPENAEAAAAELTQKATAAQLLIQAGFDPDDVLEVVGLPSMDTATVQPQPVAAPAAPDDNDGSDFQNRQTVRLQNKANTEEKVFEQLAEDFPPEAMEWAHHAKWKGPVEVPLDHIDWTPDQMDGADPGHVQHFVKKLDKGKKLKPLILVKTPQAAKLTLIDGHHRYLAHAELGKPAKAFIATVDKEHGAWDTMHAAQFGKGGRGDGPTNAATLNKSQVNYRDSTNTAKSCGTCSMFQAPHGCTLVKGVINSDDVCDRWVKSEVANLMTPDALKFLYRSMLNGHGSVPIETGAR